MIDPGGVWDKQLYPADITERRKKIWMRCTKNGQNISIVDLGNKSLYLARIIATQQKFFQKAVNEGPKLSICGIFNDYTGFDFVVLILKFHQIII